MASIARKHLEETLECGDITVPRVRGKAGQVLDIIRR
jgi:hypothetical protein